MDELKQADLVIGGVKIPVGKRKRIELSVAKLFDHTAMSIPVEVIRGKKPGPTLFISAAIHGDEINGVEVIKRLLARKMTLSKLKGTLILVPIVNVYGFNTNSRYLPDRRDLNRCFPGSEKGSLGGQIAQIFMKEIVEQSTHGIDLHTGAIHRSNIPQIRACLNDPETDRLAKAFGVPVIINSTMRDGSLREAAAEKGIPMLLFEGGEALRYEEKVIKTALLGIVSVMGAIGMIENTGTSKRKMPKQVYIAHSSHWVRAPHSGSLRIRKKMGAMVKKGQLLGIISDPYGDEEVEVKVLKTGIIIGITMLPLVNSGDALFHIATFEDSVAVEERLEIFSESLKIDGEG